MSVAATGGIIPRMWRGYDDPGLPVGAYIGNNVLIGDVTGGLNQIDFIFKREFAPADGRFYNIEQLNVFHTIATFVNGGLEVRNFETLGPFLIGAREWRFDLLDNGNANATISSYVAGIPLPLFIGQTSRLQSLDSVVSFTVPNINVVVHSVTIQGYIWEPRSILAPGGLRRPLDSLYGR